VRKSASCAREVLGFLGGMLEEGAECEGGVRVMATNCYMRGLKVSGRATHYAEEIVESLLQLRTPPRGFEKDKIISWLAGYFESYGREACVGHFVDGAGQP
jgi:hypothetical protein